MIANWPVTYKTETQIIGLILVCIREAFARQLYMDFASQQSLFENYTMCNSGGCTD